MLVLLLALLAVVCASAADSNSDSLHKWEHESMRVSTPLHLTHHSWEQHACSVTGRFTIIVNPKLHCVNPQFTIRIFNANQVAALQPDARLQVSYEVFRTSVAKVNLTTTIEVAMLYCKFNSSSLKDNILDLSAISNPTHLFLNVSHLQDADQDSACSFPPHWRIKQAVKPTLNALMGIRFEMQPTWKLVANFQYTGVNSCSIPSTNETLCVVGASHARVLQVHLHRLWKESTCQKIILSPSFWRKKVPCLDGRRRIIYIDEKYVKDFKASRLNGERCTDVVITYGQWDLGVLVFENYRSNINISQSVENSFRSHIRNMAQELKQLNVRKVNVLSMNYIPLRNFAFNVLNVTSPFPKRAISYNTPPNIKEFNRLLSEEVNALNMGNISYVDNSDIVAPLWDGAEDFNHHANEVGKAMANKIACGLYNNTDNK